MRNEDNRSLFTARNTPEEGERIASLRIVSSDSLGDGIRTVLETPSFALSRLATTAQELADIDFP